MFLGNGSPIRIRSTEPSFVLGWVVLLMVVSREATLASAVAAQQSEPEAEMTGDARRMHERLVALSQGEGSPLSLRIEFMDGGMASHRSFDLSAGKLVTKEWRSPGAAVVHLEGTVAESRVRDLLRELIAKRYWSFQGSRFVPDASVFLFRFYYGDLQHIDFRCDAEEVRESETRNAIRDTFLRFASETNMSRVPDIP